MSRTTESRFVRIPEDLYREVDSMAKEEDRSISSTVRTCVVLNFSVAKPRRENEP